MGLGISGIFSKPGNMAFGGHSGNSTQFSVFLFRSSFFLLSKICSSPFPIFAACFGFLGLISMPEFLDVLAVMSLAVIGGRGRNCPCDSCHCTFSVASQSPDSHYTASKGYQWLDTFETEFLSMTV